VNALPDDGALPLRRAALTLHALTVDDRNWLLERIDAPARQAMLDLLDELAELGIPSDGSLVEQVLADGKASATAPLASALGAHPLAAAWAVLAGEPAALRSLCLAALDERSRQAVLSEARRQGSTLDDATEMPTVAPALRDAVLAGWREAIDSRRGLANEQGVHR